MLKAFRLELITSALSCAFYPFFTEMTGSPAEMERWRRNRAMAYYGSAMHFFRALYKGTGAEEGFQLQLGIDIYDYLPSHQWKLPFNFRIVSTISQNGRDFFL